MNQMSESVAEPNSDQLYRHSRLGAEWGDGILLWENNGRRGYQFEHGGLRVLKEGYYQLMEPVDRPLADQMALAARLQREAGLDEAREERRRRAGQTGVITLRAQATYFKELYPGGFEDPKWKAEVRGDAGGRGKKLREPALAIARESLSASAIDKMIGRGDFEEVRTQLGRMLAATDLVSSKARAAIAKAGPEALARQLGQLASAPEDSAGALAELQALTGGDWGAVTTTAALLAPEVHVPVKVSAFREQARWMAPNLTLASQFDVRIYADARHMAFAVRAELVEMHLQPADLIDVHDFIWCTLKPAARTVLKKRAPKRP